MSAVQTPGQAVPSPCPSSSHLQALLDAIETTKHTLMDKFKALGYTVPLTDYQRDFGTGQHPLHGPLRWIGGPFVLRTFYTLAWQVEPGKEPAGEWWHLQLNISMAHPSHTQDNPSAIHSGDTLASFQTKQDAVDAFDAVVRELGYVKQTQVSLF